MAENKGKVVQVIGPVIDVKLRQAIFPKSTTPSKLKVTAAQSFVRLNSTLEKISCAPLR